MREPQYFLSGEVPSGQYATIDPAGDENLFRVAKPGARSPLPDCFSSDNMDLIVSRRFAQVLADIGTTGYEVVPVRLLRRDEALGGYGRLIVTGRSPRGWDGFHDEHVREQQYVEGGPWVPMQACYDPAPDGWDGSDIYTPDETAFVTLTRRVADTFTAGKLIVNIIQVGRFELPLSYEDEAAEDAWRRRMVIQPGDLPGVPVCPDLLGEETVRAAPGATVD